MRLTPDIKQGLYFGAYVLIITLLGSTFLAYLGTFSSISSLETIAGVGLVAIFGAILGFIFGWVLWHITNFLGKFVLKNNKGILQGALFAAGPALSLDLAGAIVGFFVGFTLWWLSTAFKGL